MFLAQFIIEQSNKNPHPSPHSGTSRVSLPWSHWLASNPVLNHFNPVILFTPYYSDFMQHSYASEAKQMLSCSRNPHPPPSPKIILNPNFRYFVYQRLLLVPFLSLMNPVHIIPLCSFKMHVYICLTPTLKFSHRNSVCILLLLSVRLRYILIETVSCIQ
jgi:hypothetical protein